MVVYLQFEYLADLAPDQAEQFCQTDHPESSPGVKQLETGDPIFLTIKTFEHILKACNVGNVH